MKFEQLEAFADVIVQVVETRLIARGLLPASDADRQERLVSDLLSLAEKKSMKAEVLARVRAEMAEHGFRSATEGDVIGQEGERPRAEELKPPEHGPEGPTDEDIMRERKKILDKLERLKNPRDTEYHYKLPWHVQVDVAFLVSIILELLDLILKLHERLQRIERPSPTKAKR